MMSVSSSGRLIQVTAGTVGAIAYTSVPAPTVIVGSRADSGIKIAAYRDLNR